MDDGSVQKLGDHAASASCGASARVGSTMLPAPRFKCAIVNIGSNLQQEVSPLVATIASVAPCSSAD